MPEFIKHYSCNGEKRVMGITIRWQNPILFLFCIGLLLDGCVVTPPPGPDVAVMPGPNKTLTQFQQDDIGCRQYASASTGGGARAQAANQSAVGSAVVGTALGAAAGAAIGAASGHAGPGAAIGAGAGLLAGVATGAGNAAQSAGAAQRRYDTAYAQCMATQGNATPTPVAAPAAVATYPAYPPAYVYYPYPVAPAYYAAPYAYAPPIVIGGYWGWGWRGGWGGRWRR
jgi:hypothetical protein